MYDVVVIGAGVIGCAISRELSKYKLNICVIEKNEDVADGTSKANSGIVHAGFDAKPGTLKAKLNARGNLMFDKLSKELDFPFKRNGSLVLCFDADDMDKLELLKEQGIENGVRDIRILNKTQLKELEPNVSDEAYAALYAPAGGIVCPYEMTIALAENAYENGVEFKLCTKVEGIQKTEGSYTIATDKGQFKSRIIINAAGTYSDELNNMVSENKIHIVPRKGEYCLLDKAAGNMVKRTIFQLPTKLGKGILVTPTVDGNLLVGPTAMDIEDKTSLSTTQEGLDEVLKKAGVSVKAIPRNKIITSFAGLRAHSIADDFIIGEAEDAKNFFNAAGIESPGLSCAPSIALLVEDMIVKAVKPEKNENFNPIRHGIPKFRELSDEERRKLITERPEYGKIICRCELVTEGEIIDSIRRPLGAKSLDGVKRRTRAGMGRCQAGFCSPRIVDILAKELNIPLTKVTKSGGNSELLVGKNKENII